MAWFGLRKSGGAAFFVLAGLSYVPMAWSQAGQLPAVALQDQNGTSTSGSQKNDAAARDDYGRPTDAAESESSTESANRPQKQKKTQPTQQSRHSADTSDNAVTLHEPVQSLAVQPGVNEIVKVATNHLNRIETPFENPEVMTVSQSASTKIKQNVVYVAPTGSAPVTMFINEKGDESASISLTLVPRRIPPRAFRISFMSGQTYGRQSEAENWETSSPYQESITKLLRAVAQNKIPPGYSMGRGASIDPPFCRQQGLTFDFRQKIMGRNFWVAVGTMTNRSGHRIEFNEDSCMFEQRVAAVAAWPAIILSPSDTVEIYAVIRHVADTDEAEPERPSLIADRSSSSESIGGQAGYHPAESGPYKILLPPFDSERIARQAVAALRSNGFPAETYNQAGKLFVRIPGYQSAGDAQGATQMLQRLGYSNLVVAGENYQ